MRARILLVTVALVSACSGHGGDGASAPSTTAPPATESSAAEDLAQVASRGVTVSPQPGDHFAQPGTQLSWRNTTARALARLSVKGSRSGVHTGTFQAHSDGKGVSWLPAKPFSPGETVTVSSPVTPAGATTGRWTFGVSTPVKGTKRVIQTAVAAPASQVQHLTSRPDLQPPKISVRTDSKDAAPGYLFLAPTKQGQSGPLIVDDKGQVVWFDPRPGLVVNSFEKQTYDGKPVLTWAEGIGVNGHGEDGYVIADEHYQEMARVRCSGGCTGDHHEFLLTDHGTALFSSYPVVKAGGQAVLDGMIQEIDVKTGLLVWEWHALDHVALSESYAPAVKRTDPPLDWFHLNSIQPDGTGKVLVSGRATHALYEVSTATGAIQWRLGGRKSSFAMGPGTTLHSQHDARRQRDGTITVFDNGAGVGGATEPLTRGVRLRVDTAHRRVSLVKAYSVKGRRATSQGNVQVIGDHVLMGFGAVPAVTEFSASGKVLYDATLPGRVQSYRAYRFTWSGSPATPPDAVRAGTSMVASWNGATAVARWQLLAGPDADHLTASGSAVTRSGFETTVPLGGATGTVSLAALAADGHELGRSAPQPVT